MPGRQHARTSAGINEEYIHCCCRPRRRRGARRPISSSIPGTRCACHHAKFRCRPTSRAAALTGTRVADVLEEQGCISQPLSLGIERCRPRGRGSPDRRDRADPPALRRRADAAPGARHRRGRSALRIDRIAPLNRSRGFASSTCVFRRTCASALVEVGHHSRLPECMGRQAARRQSTGSSAASAGAATGSWLGWIRSLSLGLGSTLWSHPDRDRDRRRVQARRVWAAPQAEEARKLLHLAAVTGAGH